MQIPGRAMKMGVPSHVEDRIWDWAGHDGDKFAAASRIIGCLQGELLNLNLSDLNISDFPQELYQKESLQILSRLDSLTIPRVVEDLAERIIEVSPNQYPQLRVT